MTIWIYLALLLAVMGESTIVVGVFVPGVNSIIVASFLASSGELNVYMVFAAAWLGMFIGDFIGYLLGRYGLERIPAAERAFARARSRVEAFVEQHRRLMVFYQFIGFARSPLPILLGVVRHPWRAWIWLLTRATTLFVGCLVAASYGLGHVVSQTVAIRVALGVQAVVFIVFAVIIGHTVWRAWRDRAAAEKLKN
jgi:membrane protein DedA with SNARE-associated domain